MLTSWLAGLAGKPLCMALMTELWYHNLMNMESLVRVFRTTDAVIRCLKKREIQTEATKVAIAKHTEVRDNTINCLLRKDKNELVGLLLEEVMFLDRKEANSTVENSEVEALSLDSLIKEVRVKIFRKSRSRRLA